eukprot:1565838-Rhodomonas_salina.1
MREDVKRMLRGCQDDVKRIREDVKTRNRARAGARKRVLRELRTCVWGGGLTCRSRRWSAE